jgi:hypothetical protein
MRTATNGISRFHLDFDCIVNGNKEVVNTMATLVFCPALMAMSATRPQPSSARAARSGARGNSCCTPTRATRAGCLPTPSYGKPVLLYDLKCVGSQAYLRRASEIIKPAPWIRPA